MTTLLVIEDEQDLLDSLSTALRFEGFDVHNADNGPAGLEQARQYKPDLIVCDIQLPGLDGFEVLAKVRADPILGSTPFIFLTALGEKVDMEMAT